MQSQYKTYKNISTNDIIAIYYNYLLLNLTFSELCIQFFKLKDIRHRVKFQFRAECVAFDFLEKWRTKGVDVSISKLYNVYQARFVSP